jgi:hypothetical protein
MPAEPSAEVRFEIGHVLFSYSKMLITEQSELLQTLKQIVRGTEQFRGLKLKANYSACLLVKVARSFSAPAPKAPVLCALEIGKELKKHPELPLRMGIHSVSVNEIIDLNEQR